jgi:DNA replication protein DnaC
MKNIIEIFKGNQNIETENIINSVDVNENFHKNGIANILSELIPNYIFDDNNTPILAKLFYYFIGDEEKCKSNSISLNKGVMLLGGVGTGKTQMMQAFKYYASQIIKTNSFQFHYANEIIDNTTVSGIEHLDKFNHNFNPNPNPITCLIDDICSKNEKVKNYGTDINVIEELISIRYNIYKRYNVLTHFTTNIYPNEFGEYYDLRIIDRLKEMTNIIELPGESRRK